MFNKTIKTMKSIKIFAVAGAIGLLGMAGLNSCKQNNSPETPGTYNGEVVKTEFSIAIPDAAGSDASAEVPSVKRMPSDKTQTDNPVTFLGMDNIYIVPFNVVTPASNYDLSTTKRWGNAINLTPAITTWESMSNLYGGKKYQVYPNVEVPLGTNQFLLYAHGTSTTTTIDNKLQYGLLNANNVSSHSPADITFSLQTIYTADTKDGDLCAFLSNIANANDGTVPLTDGHAWATHVNAGIKQLYDDFVTLQAGSSRSVLAVLEDLYNALLTYNETYKVAHDDGDPLTDDGDKVVQAIINKIEDKVDVSGSTPNCTLAWKDALDPYIKNFPLNIGLPDGAVVIQWNSGETKFEIISTYAWQAANSLTTTTNFTTLNQYCYPACVYYYVNSPIRTASTVKLNGGAWGSSTWGEVISSYNEANNTAVASNTRSVAIVDIVQYGVASMKTSVQASNDNIPDFNNNLMPVNKLVMTGVLIGGQNTVKYDFAPHTDAGTQVVYDSIMNGTFASYQLSTGYTPENPTLVLETHPGKDVLIAVEFLNQGDDFFGIGGKLIPHNTKFYVVAELEADVATNAALTAAHKETCVFAQDFTTTVKLNLKNLKKAYNVVPDLRKAQLELGFSVDLSWQAGHTYTINIE